MLLHVIFSLLITHDVLPLGFILFINYHSSTGSNYDTWRYPFRSLSSTSSIFVLTNSPDSLGITKHAPKMDSSSSIVPEDVVILISCLHAS